MHQSKVVDTDRYKAPQRRNKCVVTRNTWKTTIAGPKIVTIRAFGKVPMPIKLKFITAKLYPITELCYDTMTSVARVAATNATTLMD